jgi:tRNA A22 N-methylase
MKERDDVKTEIVREWLKKADIDLNTAIIMNAEGSAYNFIVCFHC